MKILITGASGFIGTHLVNAFLNNGFEVLALGRNMISNSQRKKLSYLKYELGATLPKEVLKFSPEILVNLAWEGIPDFKKELCLKNFNDQINFLQQIQKINSIKKIIVAGTCLEYGNKIGICNESEKNLPHNYFSWVKQSLSDFYSIFCKENGIKLIWFRIFYVYGLGQRSGSLIPSLIEAFKKGNAPKINNPYATNDYIYIDDLVEAFISAINLIEVEGVFNIGSGKMTATFTIAEVIEKTVYSSNNSLLINMEKDPKKTLNGFYADLRLSRTYLKWTPKWSIADGVKQMCKHMISK